MKWVSLFLESQSDRGESDKAVQEVDEVAALRVLHMEGCGYLVHPSYLLEYMDRSLSSPSPLLFIVLDDEIPRVSSLAFDPFGLIRASVSTSLV